VVFSQGEKPVASGPVTANGFVLSPASIPRDLAIPKDAHQTESKELIINIKDVHDNFGAQESIVGVLENLAMNYDIRFVGVEGTEGDIDTSLISAFPDKSAKKAAARYMMSEGRISAGEFFAALSTEPVKLFGIDDTKLYLKNYNAFLHLLEQKDNNSRLVGVLRSSLYALEGHIFSPELKELNRNSVLGNNNGKKFTERWKVIDSIGMEKGVSRNEYVNISSLIDAMTKERELNYSAINVQRDKILDELTRRLKRDYMEELIFKSLSYKLGKISKSQFYSYILLLARSEGLDTSSYDELAKFCDYVNLYESIDIGDLMDEVESYEYSIKEELYRNEDERELTLLLKNTEILENLFAVKLTSGQLAYFRKNSADFNWGKFLGFIKAKYAEYGIVIPAELSEVSGLFGQMNEAVDFYTAATDRNRAMVDNTIKSMRESGVTAAAIVTGGFHTRGITDILKSDNVSYIVLLPRFNARTGHRPYITIITNKASEYKQYAESGEYLALVSLMAKNWAIAEGAGISETASALEIFSKMYGLALMSFYFDRGVVSPEVLSRAGRELLRAFAAQLELAGNSNAGLFKALSESSEEDLVQTIEVSPDGATVTLTLGVRTLNSDGTYSYFGYTFEASRTADISESAEAGPRGEFLPGRNFVIDPSSMDSARFNELRAQASQESEALQAEANETTFEQWFNERTSGLSADSIDPRRMVERLNAHSRARGIVLAQGQAESIIDGLIAKRSASEQAAAEQATLEQAVAEQAAAEQAALEQDEVEQAALEQAAVTEEEQAETDEETAEVEQMTAEILVAQIEAEIAAAREVYDNSQEGSPRERYLAAQAMVAALEAYVLALRAAGRDAEADISNNYILMWKCEAAALNRMAAFADYQAVIDRGGTAQEQLEASLRMQELLRAEVAALEAAGRNEEAENQKSTLMAWDAEVLRLGIIVSSEQAAAEQAASEQVSEQAAAEETAQEAAETQAPVESSNKELNALKKTIDDLAADSVAKDTPLEEAYGERISNLVNALETTTSEEVRAYCRRELWNILAKLEGVDGQA
nr:hypothetical protein [Candidatus Omnitrophota bacterium]